MKHKTWLSLFVLSAVLGLTLLASAWLNSLPTLAQSPVDNTITYQGRLRLADGDYVNGGCDFQFTLWNADFPSGTQVAGPLDRNDVAVTDGYFTVALDFGDVFNGEERYLQIAVRCPAGSGDYDTLNGRVNLYPTPYALGAPNAAAARVPWSGVTGKPPGFADDVDDVVTYTNGFGLDLSPENQFSVITGTFVNSDTLQRRVAAACTGEQTIQAINPDGSVRCVIARTDYAATDGVEEHVDPVTLHHVLEYDADVVQERVTFACGSQRAIRRINPNGSVYCEAIHQGDITAVYASDGLTGGGESGVVTVTVEAGGITTSKLITSAVTKQKIIDGAVNRDKIADDAITSFNLADGGILFEDINQNECTDNKIMAYSTAISSWECTTDTVDLLQPGNGIAIAQVAGDQVISARVGDGIKLDPDDGQKIAVDFASTGADTAAHSDHHHDDGYPCLSDFGPSCTDSPGGDVSGNYSAGFTVNNINQIPIEGPFNSTNDILRYDAGKWKASNPSLPVKVKVASGKIQDNGCVSCEAGYQVVSGGCNCTNTEGEWVVEDAYPLGNSFCCNCSRDKEFDAYALCLKTEYLP